VSDFATFVQLGLRHIIDLSALDHILFLLALAAIYRFSDLGQILRVVTAFTVGHSITLAAAVFGVFPLSQAVVEFLIPLTIVATCVENILIKPGQHARAWPLHRAVFAGIFGLIHGAGFGGYLRSLFLDDVALPLLGFNIGIELGQVAILSAVFIAVSAIDLGLNRLHRKGSSQVILRVRTVTISLVVMAFAAEWAVQRAPW
jgi:hypothetical protein